MTNLRHLTHGIRWTALLLMAAVAPIAQGQDLDATVVRNPDDTVTYTIDIDGPPRGAAFVFLPPFPLVLDPFLTTNGLPLSWIGSFSVLNFPGNNENEEPERQLLFDFNFNLEFVETPDFSHLVISSGDADNNKPAPGLTCFAANGCGPIAFSVPFEPIVFLPQVNPPSNPSVVLDLLIDSSELTSSEQQSQASIELSFIDLTQDYFNPGLNNLVDALSLPGSVLTIPFNDPLNLAPLGPPGTSSLPILPLAPGIAGLELFTQALDPRGPTMTFYNLRAGENVGIGNSLVITVREAPAPATLGLLGLGLLMLRRRRR